MRPTEVVTAVLGLAYEVGRLRRIAPSYRSFTSCICIRWSPMCLPNQARDLRRPTRYEESAAEHKNLAICTALFELRAMNSFRTRSRNRPLNGGISCCGCLGPDWSRGPPTTIRASLARTASPTNSLALIEIGEALSASVRTLARVFSCASRIAGAITFVPFTCVGGSDRRERRS